MALLDFILGTESKRYVRRVKASVAAIESRRKELAKESDDALRKKTDDFRVAVKGGATLDSILEEAFAVVCEAARRTTGMDPFNVQVIGGMAIHNGSIAEMRTGEGKTLVAVLPAYLNALSGNSVHIVTVNDYLARRDAVWMGQVFSFLGMTVGVVNSQNQSYRYDPDHRDHDKERDEEGAYKVVHEFLRDVPRKDVYASDIVYGTNNEFVFDYLRDNIEYEKDNIRHRGFHFAIVDEVDSILIDEARSPLIISSPVEIPASHYTQFATFADTLEEEKDYTIDEKQRAVSLTPDGIQKFERILKVENVYVEGSQRAVHYLQNALKAKSLFTKDRQYVVRDGSIVIVDEFTGRLQPGRQWSEGLHQAIEAKEGVKVQQETRTYASITFQNYFRMYDKLAGMTGTALSSEEEFYKVYKVPVLSIPTNKPVQRVDHSDVIYSTRPAKLRAAVKKIQELHEKGQPVLVGTTSIDHSEEISKRLKKKKVPHEVLNAKNHEQEGEVIAQAGRRGMVTIATNLAGRGVDIKLGGADGADRPEDIKKLGGLFVLGTERHESRRIDDQLRGRCGRQGDEGETQFFISLEDDLARIFGSDRIRSVAQKMGLPEDQAIQNKMISKSIESAQKRIEGHHFDSRRFSLEYDTVLDKHRSEVYKKRRSMLLTDDQGVLADFFSRDDLVGENGEAVPTETLRRAVLRSIDVAWMEHLELMDYARSSANLRSYGQREPLMEYKREGARLFQGFWDHVKEKVKESLQSVAKVAEE
ncbi:MAG: preprotein translocase subunit SecA [Candidatus Kaiserbacteria bacterium]|nr:preprotein translocase subunit SecA [Candidatus Kaiserbacteria bacterium]